MLDAELPVRSLLNEHIALYPKGSAFGCKYYIDKDQSYIGLALVVS